MLYPFHPFAFGPLFDGGSPPPPPVPPPPEPYPGAFWGFAHPSDPEGATVFFGQGFGDPSDYSGEGLSPPSFGFGAPYDSYLDAIHVTAGAGSHGTPDGLPWVPDDGGEILQVAGPWSPGTPLRVKVRNRDSLVVYPADPTKPLTGMRGVKPGAGTSLIARADGFVAFCLCPLPLGTYDILLLSGPSEDPLVTVEEAFRVVYRHYCREAWNIRSSVPAHWRGMGPRAMAAEPMEGSNSVFPQLNLRSLTAAVGEEIQGACGKAVTRLTQETTWSPAPQTLHVETTLGFASSGTLTAGGWEYSYSGRTPDTFTGCVPKRVYPENALSPGETVTAMPASWRPED